MWKWTIISIVFYLLVVIVTKIAGKGKQKKYGKSLDFSKHEDQIVVIDGTDNGSGNGDSRNDNGKLNNDIVGE